MSQIASGDAVNQRIPGKTPHSTAQEDELGVFAGGCLFGVIYRLMLHSLLDFDVLTTAERALDFPCRVEAVDGERLTHHPSSRRKRLQCTLSPLRLIQYR